MEAFDAVRIDCLNGDKRKTGKVAPDGTPDPSIFSTPGDPVGIQVGTAITTLVRKCNHAPAEDIGFRHLWGQGKREELVETAEVEPSALYERIKPVFPLGLPFAPTAVSADWFEWPALPDLFPVSFPGVQTSRDGFLVDTDLSRLKAHIGDYFDPALGHEEIARRYPAVMKTTARFDARAVRAALLARGGPNEDGFIRHAYRPFDDRWLYWEADTKLLDEKRADYRPHVFEGNLWFCNGQHLRKDAEEPQSVVTRHIGARHLIERGANWFPAWLLDDAGMATGTRRPNLSPLRNGISTASTPVWKTCSITSSPCCTIRPTAMPTPGRCVWNGRASRYPAGLTGMPPTWRSPSPNRRPAAANSPDCLIPTGRSPALLKATSARKIAAIAVPATTDGRNMTGDDFALTAGWGHYGSGGAVMPGQGRAEQRPVTSDERATFVGATGRSPLHSPTTFDIYLNGHAYWRNVPAAVWRYKLGGYQVLKKWLSYRERNILARPLTPAEVQHFTDTARRIAAILMLTDT